MVSADARPVASAPDEPPKRKRGRPRKALSVLAFLTQLRFELEQNILSSAVADALSSLRPREDDNELEGVRNLLMNALGSVEAIREYVELSRS